MDWVRVVFKEGKNVHITYRGKCHNLSGALEIFFDGPKQLRGVLQQSSDPRNSNPNYL